MEIRSIESFLEYDARIHERTLRVIRRIPPTQIEWRCVDGKFSFGDIIRHLAAMERDMWAENVQGRPSRYPGHGRELADGCEAVMQYFEDMHAESVSIFSTLTTDDLQRKCRTPGGVEMVIWKWLRAKVEHEIHHRGQIYAYLGMLGIATPPLYGLTSEEVRTNSSP